MDTKLIEEKVKKIIFTCLNDRIIYEDITNEKNLIHDLRVESFELIQIFYSIMAEFSIEMDSNEVSSLNNISDIILYIQRRLLISRT